MQSTSLARHIAAASTYSSWKRVPHVSFICEPEVTLLFNHYSEMKNQFAAREEVNLSFNTLVVKIIADALADYPRLCCSFRYHVVSHRLEYTAHDSVDINIPWLLPNGDMVPFLFRDVARLSLSDFAREIEKLRSSIPGADIDRLMLSAAIRDTLSRLRRLELSAVTRMIPLALLRLKNHAREQREGGITADRIDPNGIVISNIGSLLNGTRGRFSLLEIIEPKVLAIGISSIEELVRSGTDEPGKYYSAKILPITIAFDHRAIDFNDIVPFVSRLEEKLNRYRIPQA